MIEPDTARRDRVFTCTGCGGLITDQYVLHVAPDLEWHSSCLKCVECGQQLDEQCTCFLKDGKTYCRADYTRLFGVKCSRCNLGFDRNDLVMRARMRVYHIDCFRCVACCRRLVPGDEFALRDDGLLCRADHDVIGGVGGASASPSPSTDTMNADDTTVFLNNNNDAKGIPCDENSPSQSPSSSIVSGLVVKRHHVTGSGTRGGGVSSRSHKSDQKTTRVRTVLNEKQLHTLRTCYGANPRPDALMKDQLVEMTGLSSRVIRVWFQNKRCKDKKRTILIKQIQQQHQDKVHGVPMIASSPVRHEPPSGMQPTPVEVQQYIQHIPPPPSWGTMDYGHPDPSSAQSSSMDHHHAIEEAPFQQLLSSFGGGDPDTSNSNQIGDDDDDDDDDDDIGDNNIICGDDDTVVSLDEPTSGLMMSSASGSGLGLRSSKTNSRTIQNVARFGALDPRSSNNHSHHHQQQQQHLQQQQLHRLNHHHPHLHPFQRHLAPHSSAAYVSMDAKCS